MSQQNVRNNFIKHNRGIRLKGYGGWWYKCANCGNWCGRPGQERANIPDHMKMEVDHIIPWSMGGSDAVSNLQPLCRPCNRAKGNSRSFRDNIKATKNTILHPVDTLIKTPIRKAYRQNKVLKFLGLNKRK